MVSEIRSFQTLKELLDYVNEEIKIVGEAIRRHQIMLEEATRRIEAYKRISGTIISSERAINVERGQEIDFHGIGIMINPNPEGEVEVIEEVLKKLNDRLTGLYKVRKALELLGIDPSAKINCQVVIIDDCPKKLIIKF